MGYLQRFRFCLAVVAIGSIFTLGSCKKFLDVDPPLALSGNNFWKTEKDFEQYMLGLYAQFKVKTMGINNSQFDVQFFPAVGDFRCAPVLGQNIGGDRQYITLLARNDLRTLTGQYNETYWKENNGDEGGGAFQKNTDWSALYRIIAGCNIMVDQLNNGDNTLSAAKRAQYLGEAVFLRNLVFFMMARLYGDIPYSIVPYDKDPQPRQEMVSVLRKCLTDLRAVVDGLPWTYVNPADKGARAMKGSALNLMMNINMWCAGFDKPNQQTYWQQTDSLGTVLLNGNGGAYELLPLEQYREVFKGGTSESLFEIRQNLNTGETFDKFASFGDNVLAFPYKLRGTDASDRVFAAYNLDFIYGLFPAAERTKDKRWTTFFYMPPGVQDGQRLQYLKFLNVYLIQGEDLNPDDCQMIFRLPDAMLLKAEACANLGGAKQAEAITLLNAVRRRAGASEYPENGYNSLSDAIYYERTKELFGESYYYFDLVRTGKVTDPTYCYNPISVNDFALGAWTWPISNSALNNNPLMTLNTFWTR